MGADARGTDIIRTVIPVIRAGRTIGKVGMRAGSGPIAKVIRALVPVIRARGPGCLVVREARARAVARVGISTVTIGRIAASRAPGQIGMRTGTSPVTDVIRAIVSFVRARGSRDLIVKETRSGSITGVRVGAIIVGGITTRGTRGQVRMAAPTGAVTDIVGAVVPVVGAGGSRRLVVREADTGPVASIRVRAVRSAGVASGRTRRQTRLDAHPGRADVVRTIICVIYTSRAVRDVRMYTATYSIANIDRALTSVIRADRPDQLVVGEAYARPITGIGGGTVGVARVAASRARRQIRMGAENS